MGFTLTSEQKVELERNNGSTAPVPIPGASGQTKGVFHNPVTGQEIKSLADPYHADRRRQQGWQWGPASPELKEKWKVREAELSAEDDAYVKSHIASTEHVESERTRFNEAVAAAVTQVLEKLESRGEAAGVEVEAASPAATPAPDPNQSSFLASVDAPPESETKQVVSQASQPVLHLVDLGDN